MPPPRDDGSIWGWLTGDEPEQPPQRGGYGPGGGRQQQPEEDDTFSWVANSASFYAGEFSRNVKSMTDAIAEVRQVSTGCLAPKSCPFLASSTATRPLHRQISSLHRCVLPRPTVLDQRLDKKKPLTLAVPPETCVDIQELLGPAEDEEGEEIIPEDEENRGEGRVVAGGAAVSASRRTKKDDKDNAPKTAPKKKKTEEEEEEDTLGGFLNMLGLDDDEEEEGKAPRRDCKKDK